MKYRICIVICYFGTFPNTIDTFLFSCKRNPEIDWIIFTDCETKDVPSNVKIIKTTLANIKALAEKKLNMQINLESPYKLCDYKVAYGLIFEDYLKGYDFWGYGDLDVVYGNLKNFFTDELLEKYDKIFPLGHLSIIKNNEQCKKIFMSDIAKTSYYKNVFSTEISCFFDEENGINDKFEAAGLNIYTKFDFADIDGMYKRLRNVDKKTLKVTLPKFKYYNNLRKNYKNQIFYYFNDNLYQRYIEKGTVKDEEIAYIHYRRKLKSKWNENDSVMIISPKGIVGTDIVPNEKLMQKYNAKKEYEFIVFIKFLLKKMKTRLPAILKDKMISILGKSMILRKVVRKIKRILSNTEDI